MNRRLACTLAALIVGCGGDSGSRAPKETKTTGAAAPNAQTPTAAVEPANRPVAKDAFAVGSVFKGRRAMPKAPNQGVILVIMKRDGADFEGEITVGDATSPAAIRGKVKGKAAVGNGRVAFDMDKVGQFQQSFTGDFSDGKLMFECRGTNRGGEHVEGKGVMEREK